MHAAYKEVKRLLTEARPDAICLIAGDHIEGFFLTAVPLEFPLPAGERARVRGRPVHEPLARAILVEGIEREFDLAYSQDIRLDYAFYVPLHFTMPAPPVPIVPLYVNVYLPPQPTPRRCYAWGRALREILDARPERVALMASGGMSHYPGTDRYASPDFDWDRQLLAALTEGRGAETARLTGEELDKSGNVELRTWITLLGAVGPARAQVICYEPSWHHGNAVVTWPVAPAGAGR